jgi:hypothetical protein
MSFNLTNSVVLAQQNLVYGLIAGAIPQEQVRIDHSIVQGQPGYIFVNDYNYSGTSVTYGEALAGLPGIAMTNSEVVDDAKLDPETYKPLPDSPAIGQAVPVENAPDYTGQIWAIRRTAGAFEAPPSPSASPPAGGPDGNAATAPAAAASRDQDNTPTPDATTVADGDASGFLAAGEWIASAGKTGRKSAPLAAT